MKPPKQPDDLPPEPAPEPGLACWVCGTSDGLMQEGADTWCKPCLAEAEEEMYDDLFSRIVENYNH